MAFKKFRDSAISFVIFLLILSISAAVIAYGKGYRFDLKQKLVKPTGLIAATSDPTGAQVFIDGKLTTATNNSINVTPGWHTVSIRKESFQTWEKKVHVQGEVVTRADAYLFPANPSLSTLSTNGVVNPVLSPDGAKLAFIVPNIIDASNSATPVTKPGIWILDLTEKPLGFNRDARQIAKSVTIDFSQSILTWSPDSKEIVATIPNFTTSLKTYYILDSGKLNDPPLKVLDITAKAKEWQDIADTKAKERVSGFKPKLVEAIQNSMNVINFSPDESKILYEASSSGTMPKMIDPPLIGTNSTAEIRELMKGSIYVYDIKEDRNYLIGDAIALGITKPEVTPTPAKKVKLVAPTPSTLSYQFGIWNLEFGISGNYLPIMWLPTSRHLIVVSKDKVETMDFDATNKKVIYAGPFWDGFVAPWINASRILILTNFNPAASTIPNLYAVNLR